MKRKVTIKNMLGYASINFLGSGAQSLISAFLMYFYTTLCGLSATQVGVIFSVTRLIDAIGNPIIGFISDNFGKTRMGKRFGRRKSFTLIGIPLTLIVFPILWTTGHSYGFYFFINLVWEVTFTLVVVTGTTLPAEMARTAADKTKLVSAKQYCGTIASAIATFIPAQLFLVFGQDDSQAFLLTGVIYGVILSLSLVVFYLLTFERDPSEIQYSEEAKGVGQVLKKIFTDIPSSLQIKTFRFHALMMLIIGIYKNLAQGVFTYFVVYVLLLSSSTTGFITSASTLLSFIGLAIAITLCYKFGGPKTFRVAAVVVIASTLGYLGLIGLKGSSIIVPALIVAAVINTIGKQACDYIPVFQLPFMADIDEAVTGQRREGIFSGVNGLLSKVATSIEGLLLGVVLDGFGFTKGAKVQPDSAITGLIILSVVTPIVLLLITWFITTRFNLTKESHKILVDEVNRVKAGGDKALATAEAKAVIKDLTGYDYEHCFGNNHVGYHAKNTTAGA
ncbi:MFS transporter [Clostridium sp. SHJSY1]|uniref:MFS transporter n=1 Tax=Clostridium sp. SHJSY1 TaxID=2942483 RepID=UPI002873FAC4|nr:MFS transporter [Clostridium sp. SHJSY1]MDS0526439.1 MFS transporter [Clostridium sp. SHJSY1]